MSIQWFPGHMAKARREVSENLKLVDVVFEILDARLPASSRNPMMEELIQHKPTVIVLGKADMADESVTDAYVRAWTKTGEIAVVPVDSLRGNGMTQAQKAAVGLTQEKFARLAAKGIRKRPIRAMVIGIPNVGKSTFINRSAGRHSAKTGDKPGVTKQQQWVKVGNLELLDTPGILWPKFDDPETALRLAWSGAIKATILQTEELALSLISWMLTTYPDRIVSRYATTVSAQDPMQCLEGIARERGALLPGGEPDVRRAAEMFLRDVQTGRLGRISFERPVEVRG